MGLAVPIPTTTLPVASIRAYPIPAPAQTAKRAAIAAERVDCLSFGCCSILFTLSMCEAAEPVFMRSPLGAVVHPWQAETVYCDRRSSGLPRRTCYYPGLG